MGFAQVLDRCGCSLTCLASIAARGVSTYESRLLRARARSCLEAGSLDKEDLTLIYNLTRGGAKVLGLPAGYFGRLIPGFPEVLEDTIALTYYSGRVLREPLEGPVHDIGGGYGYVESGEGPVFGPKKLLVEDLLIPPPEPLEELLVAAREAFMRVCSDVLPRRYCLFYAGGSGTPPEKAFLYYPVLAEVLRERAEAAFVVVSARLLMKRLGVIE